MLCNNCSCDLYFRNSVILLSKIWFLLSLKSSFIHIFSTLLATNRCTCDKERYLHLQYIWTYMQMRRIDCLALNKWMYNHHFRGCVVVKYLVYGTWGQGFESRPRQCDLRGDMVISCLKLAKRLKYCWSNVNPARN